MCSYTTVRLLTSCYLVQHARSLPSTKQGLTAGSRRAISLPTFSYCPDHAIKGTEGPDLLRTKIAAKIDPAFPSSGNGPPAQSPDAQGAPTSSKSLSEMRRHQYHHSFPLQKTWHGQGLEKQPRCEQERGAEEMAWQMPHS